MSIISDRASALALAACEIAGLAVADTPWPSEAIENGNDVLGLAFDLRDGSIAACITCAGPAALPDLHACASHGRQQAAFAARKAMEVNLALIEDGVCFAVDAEEGGARYATRSYTSVKALRVIRPACGYLRRSSDCWMRLHDKLQKRRCDNASWASDGAIHDTQYHYGRS